MKHENSGPAVLHWHSGYNHPGYLPETEPDTHSSFEAARDALAEQMETHAHNEETWADEHDCDDIPCRTYGDACHWQRASKIRAERRGLLDGVCIEWNGVGVEWSCCVGELAYWVQPCESIKCVEELAAQVAREFADESSPLLVLATSGAILPGAAEEADENRQAATAGDQSDLELLCSYIAAIGERPPVLGWLIR